jgi:hypothetical protein
VLQEEEFWGFFCEDLGLRPYRRVEASRSKAAVGTSRFGRHLVVRRPEVSLKTSRKEKETRNREKRGDNFKLISGRKREHKELERCVDDGDEKEIDPREDGISGATTTEPTLSESDTLSVSTSSPVPSPPLPKKMKPNQVDKKDTNHNPCNALPAENKVTQTRTGRTIKSPLWMKDHFPRPIPASSCVAKLPDLSVLKGQGLTSCDSVGVVEEKGNGEQRKDKAGNGKDMDLFCEEKFADEKKESAIEMPTHHHVAPKSKHSTKPKGKNSIKINHSSLEIPKIPARKNSKKKQLQLPCEKPKPNKLPSEKLKLKERVRGSRCHRCKGCMRSTDCGKCINCLYVSRSIDGQTKDTHK